MICTFSAGQVKGIFLLDSQGSTIACVPRAAESYEGSRDYSTTDIEEGQEIIGVMCSAKKHHSNITRLGFNLWTPNRNLIKIQTLDTSQSRTKQDLVQNLELN